MKSVEYLLKNFATPIAFFLTFRAVGAKPAIALAIGVTLIQIIYHQARGQKFTPFFVVASGFTLLFGSMDLFVQTPRFFRLEPFAQNFIMGVIFVLTNLFRVPVIEWFARALPKKMRPNFERIPTAYFRKVTWVWVVYFWVKGAFFLWLAFQVDLGNLILLRSVIGGGTLALMVLGEIIYRRLTMHA